MRKLSLGKLIAALAAIIGGVIFTYEYTTMPHGYLAGYVLLSVYLLAGFGLVVGTVLLILRRTRRGGWINMLAVAIFLGTFFVGIHLADQLGYLGWKNKKMVPVGQNVVASLVIYFKAGVTNTQIEAFSAEVLHKPYIKGYGQAFQEGICVFLRLGPLQEHEGIAITFCKNATPSQCGNLKTVIESSPLVYKLFENIAPINVKRLD